MNAMIPPVLVLIGFAALAAPPAIVFTVWLLWQAHCEDRRLRREGRQLPGPQPRYVHAEVRVVRAALPPGKGG